MRETVFLGTTDGLLTFSVEGREAVRTGHTLHGRYITALAQTDDGILASVLVHGVCRLKLAASSFDWVLEADVQSLATHPRDGRVCLAGTEPASIFRSEDGGRTWRERKALRSLDDAGRWYHPSPTARPRALGLAFHPADPQTFYAGIEVGGVYKTLDGGESFASASAGLYPDVHRLVAHSTRPEVLFAVTGQGVYKTENGAATWRLVSRGMSRRYVASAGIAAAPVEALVAGASHGPPWNASCDASAMIFRSSSGGELWATAMEGLPDTLDGVPVGFATSTVFPGRLYCGVASGELLASDTGGRSWRLLAGDQPPIQAVLCVPAA